jgi:chromosome segregation ATPase
MTDQPQSAAPAPVVSDAEMATAVSSLEMLAGLYSGMDKAMQALRQVGSLGRAVTERQNQLNALDAQLAQARAELAALQGDAAKQTDGAKSIVADAVAKADTLRSDADAYAGATRAQALKDAQLVRDAAVAEASAMRAAADQQVADARGHVAQAQSDVRDIHGLKGVLSGELEDLKTKVAVARSSLRQLLGEAP